MEQESKTVTQIINEVKEQMCDHYCRYRDLWNENTTGEELWVSEICHKCPLERL